MGNPRALARRTFSSPISLKGLLDLINEAGPYALLVAGGQSLLPGLLRNSKTSLRLIDVTRVAELRRLACGLDYVEIGAAVTFSEIHSSQVGNALPALDQALRALATITIRNRATVGGSLAFADPRAQLPVVLLIHDAIVCTSHRDLPIVALVRGPFRTALTPGEVITGVRIRHGDHIRRGFVQFLDRNSAGTPVVSVAAARALKSEGHEMIELAVAGLTDRPVKSPPLNCSSASVADVVDDWLDSIAQSGPQLPDAFHSAPYRRKLAGVLFRRVYSEMAQ